MDMIDFKMTVSGEIELDEAGDFKLVQGDEALIQTVMFRMKTTRGDWLLSPLVGTDMENYIGKFQTKETLRQIELEAYRELRQVPELVNIEVSAAPKDDTTVWILIEFDSIDDPKSQISLVFDLDLKTGEVKSRDNLI